MQNAVLDFLLPFIRNPFFWAPLYLFLIIVMWEKFAKKGMLWVLFFTISFAIGDFFSTRLLKPLFMRVRPCSDAMWHDVFRHLVPNSSGPSFPSSHATNHFALAVFIIITCGHFHKSIKWLAIFWASLVAYAQVYVGVHYPLDVLGGALLGSWIGYTVGNYFNMRSAL